MRRLFLLLTFLVISSALSACGSPSTTPANSNPSAPTYRDILVNVTYQVCGSNSQYSEEGVFVTSYGIVTQCSWGADPLGEYPPYVNVSASCDYNPTKAVIGYRFSCTANSPSDAGGNCRDSANEQYQVVMQTPQKGAWWFEMSSDSMSNDTFSPEPFSPISGLVSPIKDMQRRVLGVNATVW